MKKTVILAIILMILSFIAGLIVSRVSFTGRVIQEQAAPEQYSWTKAICNSKNECVDVKIDCENNKVKNFELVSGLIENSGEWQDPRGNLSENLC